jgi:hypothetical protein
MAPRTPQGDWAEWRTHVLEELKRLSAGIDGVKGRIDEMNSIEIGSLKAQIAVLQVKSGVWGFLAGAVPSAVAVVYMLLHK